jgi:hypothetical protein
VLPMSSRFWCGDGDKLSQNRIFVNLEIVRDDVGGVRPVSGGGQWASSAHEEGRSSVATG